MRKKLLILSLWCVSFLCTSQERYRLEMEKEIYDENHYEMEIRLDIIVNDQFQDIINRYTIEEKYLGQLKNLIYLKEMRKMCYDYIYTFEHEQRYQMKQVVESGYANPILQIIFLSGNDVSSPNLFIAAKWRKYLELTEEQEEELTTEAILNKALLDENPRMDLWKKELEALRRILTDRQFDDFFVYKNSDRTWRDTRVYWSRLKEFGMTHDLDSTLACQQMFTHQMKIKKAGDIYTYDDIKKREAWAEIDRSAPLPMRRVYSLSRKNIVQKKGYKGSFTW